MLSVNIIFSLSNFVFVNILPCTIQYSHSVVLLYNVVMVTGTVIRIGQVNMLESSRVYQCDKCHHQRVVKVTKGWYEYGY